MRRCESCGKPGDVILRDESVWCLACHTSALNLGYDRDGGTLVDDYRPRAARIARAVAAVVLLYAVVAVVLDVSQRGGWLRFVAALLIAAASVLVARREGLL